MIAWCLLKQVTVSEFPTIKWHNNLAFARCKWQLLNYMYRIHNKHTWPLSGISSMWFKYACLLWLKRNVMTNFPYLHIKYAICLVSSLLNIYHINHLLLQFNIDSHQLWRPRYTCQRIEIWRWLCSWTKCLVHVPARLHHGTEWLYNQDLYN